MHVLLVLQVATEFTLHIPRGLTDKNSFPKMSTIKTQSVKKCIESFKVTINELIN